MKNESKSDYFGAKGNGSYSDTIAIIDCVFNAPLMFIAIIGNSLVLVAILRTHSLRSPSTVFLYSLALSDLFVGLVVQPLFIAYRLTYNHSLLYACNILASFARAVSLCTMATISMDRFLALHYHMRYPDLMTTKRATNISATLWFIWAFLSCSYLLSKKMFFVVNAVSIAICLLISTFAYVKIYRIVHHHQLQIQAQQQAEESLNTEHNLNMARSKKSAMNTFIYYMCLVLCYAPLFFYSLVLGSFKFNEHWITVEVLANTLACLNSSINPFLYCWRFREIRVAVVKTLRKMLCKQTD